MTVSPQCDWFNPSHRQSGASMACRTNQAMTKLWVISRSCRSWPPGTKNSLIASAICARPASTSAGVTAANHDSNAFGVSGVIPEGTQSNSRADGRGSTAGSSPERICAVSVALRLGAYQAFVSGTPPSRAASSSACRRPRGESGPSLNPCSASRCSPWRTR